MSIPTLDHLTEGTAVRDGHAQRLYDPAQPTTVRQALLQRGINFNVGPLAIAANVDLAGGPSVTVVVTLLGLELANSTLTPDEQNLTIGGSVAGFKAQLEVSLTQDPLQLAVDGELCAPFGDCESVHQIFPL